MPAKNIEPYFEAATKRISFKRTSLQRTFTYKPIRRNQKCACKENKFCLFVHPKKLFCCDPRDQHPKIINFDVSVLYPKKYIWTKSDAFFDFESSDNNSDSDDCCRLSDSTDCIELVLKAIEQRTTTAITSGPINKDCASVDYTSVVEGDMKEELEDLHLEDSKSISNAVRLPKSHSLCDEVDVNAPLQSLKRQLKKQNNLKRQLIATYNEQVRLLKRIKLEMKLCADRTNEINTQIDLRQSLLHTRSQKKLPKDFSTQMKMIESKVKPLDSVIDNFKDTCKMEITEEVKTEELVCNFKKKQHKCGTVW